MTYETLMVHLEASQSNANVLHVTAEIARRFQAKVIGIASCEPIQIGFGEGMMNGEIALAERQIVDDELKVVGAEFHACEAIRPYVLQWRSIPTMEPVAHVVALEARAADLVITSVLTGVFADTSRHADTADLVIRAGRPVLAVPPKPVTANFQQVMIAWNDTRECRRAVSDALPFLKEAEQVVVVGVGADPIDIGIGVADVVGWLSRHGIHADRIVSHAVGGGSTTLAAIATENSIDLIVAGAYGHTRLREWAFGGVTRDLLLQAHCCALLSH
ncbi:MAG: universal stress protein [Pseudomonadota bacterium]|nr:universal stress protein [Pseudomonadota bacterium]